VRQNVTFAAATLALWAAALSPVAAKPQGWSQSRNLAVKVTAVTPGMPAARRGIVVGDIIVSVNGNRVASTDDLTFFLRRAGRVARLEVIAGSRTRDRPVFLDVSPVNGRIGINARQVTLPAWSPRPDQNLAVKVTAVTPGMPAARRGIVVGDIIVSVNGNRVASTDDLVYFLRRASRVARLEVIAGRRPRDRPVFLDVSPVNGRIGINARQVTLPAWAPRPNPTPFSAPIQPLGRGMLES
jgi:S1-C subfamily serine protease